MLVFGSHFYGGAVLDITCDDSYHEQIACIDLLANALRTFNGMGFVVENSAGDIRIYGASDIGGAVRWGTKATLICGVRQSEIGKNAIPS